MEGQQLTPEFISAAAGSLLSLGFSYIPGLADWFDRLGRASDAVDGAADDGGTRKRLVMLALLVLVAGGAFGLACSGWGAEAGLQLTCDRPGAAGLLWSLILAVMANQSTYKISPRRAGPRVRQESVS